MHFQFPSQRKLREEEANPKALFSYKGHTCGDATRGNIFFGMHSIKKGHNKLNSWFFGGPSFEFFFFLFLETQWQFSYLIFDFPFIPIFGTSFWSWKHRFGFDGVGSKRAYMRDTIQKVFPCCQPSRDLRSSRLESLKAKILSNSGKRTSFLEKKGLEK